MAKVKNMIEKDPETHKKNLHPRACLTLVEALHDGLLVLVENCIFFANSAGARLVADNSTEAVIGLNLSTLLHPESQDAFAQMCQDLNAGEKEYVRLELRFLRLDTEMVFVEATCGTTSFDHKSSIYLLMRDISRRKIQEKRIHYQANYDQLTTLPNRSLFYERLKHEIVRASRQHSHIALMFIDLDRFKWVNDTMGHPAGDELLRQVAVRLKGCLRQSDTIARMGGDEFTAILPDMTRGPHAERVASQILDQLSMVFMLEGQEAFISGSIGITLFPDDANTVDDLMKNADSAMYHAKKEGRNGYRFFTPNMQTEALERMQLEKDLHCAMSRNELIIHFQPIVNLSSNRIVGAESFLRWHHATRGWVAPDLFIPVAEETGLIGQITEWAIRLACEQAQGWRELDGFADFFISVNLSCTRCRELSTDDKIPDILRQTGLPPTALVLEITENILMEDEHRAMAMLHHLRKLGVNLWLDDFGTGYSSLSILKRLPVSGIKIDRTFIPDVNHDRETEVLVEAIMSLAKSLERMVIGEGVESQSQVDFLRQRGCDMVQGYFYGRPMGFEEFKSFLYHWRATPTDV
ncbi:MAG: EAL domain-containing protein [Magnetococcus sp. DMHC-6]